MPPGFASFTIPRLIRERFMDHLFAVDFEPREYCHSKARDGIQTIAMETYLAPIEKPRGLFMKQAYRMTRKRFGKVLTPLKVVYARLPAAFALFSSKIAELDRKLELPPETAMLVREQVARINVCEFCIDIGRSITIRASMDQKKFDAIGEYPSSPLFSEAERAALDYVTELTRQKIVSPKTFARLAEHYSERQICEIAWLVATEHYYNLVNIGLNIHSDLLCDIAKARKAGAA